MCGDASYTSTRRCSRPSRPDLRARDHSRIVVVHRLAFSTYLVRTPPLPPHIITISRIHGVIVFAAFGAYEGKADMNGKSEWVNQGECIRITTATGFFMVGEKEREREEEVGGRERERQSRATGSETGQPRYTQHGVFTNCLISSTNRRRACFFVPSGCPSLPPPLPAFALLSREQRCAHVALIVPRDTQLSNCRPNDL